MHVACCLHDMSASCLQGWCQDFLGAGTIQDPGSCCTRDEQVEAWCQTTAGKADARYLSACAPWSEQFGSKRYAVDATTGELVTPSAQDWQQIGEDAGMCDVLGEVCFSTGVKSVIRHPLHTFTWPESPCLPSCEHFSCRSGCPDPSSAYRDSEHGCSACWTSLQPW